jgi:hypothetical protein
VKTSNPTSAVWLPGISSHITHVKNSTLPCYQSQPLFPHINSIIMLGFYLTFISINNKLKLDNSINNKNETYRQLSSNINLQTDGASDGLQ